VGKKVSPTAISFLFFFLHGWGGSKCLRLVLVLLTFSLFCACKNLGAAAALPLTPCKTITYDEK